MSFLLITKGELVHEKKKKKKDSHLLWLGFKACAVKPRQEKLPFVAGAENSNPVPTSVASASNHPHLLLMLMLAAKPVAHDSSQC